MSSGPTVLRETERRRALSEITSRVPQRLEGEVRVVSDRLSLDSAQLPQPQPQPRVLHVTEALGGVPVSVQHLIDATPYAEHYYAAITLRPHPNTALPGRIEEGTALHAKNGLAWRRAVRQLVDKWQPTHIHFHSSYAGLWGRLRRFGTQTVLYTPHCYAFERNDIGPLVRRSVRITEAALSRKTDVVAAISDREAALSLALGKRNSPRVVTAFNPIKSSGSLTPRQPRKAKLTIGTMGRITRQKDPEFFLQVVAHAKRLRPDLDAQWVWIGQGDATSEAQLRDAGVRVTGWLPAAEAERELREIEVYVHTAAWEGFPLAVTEAIGQGIPLVLRNVDAFPSSLQILGSSEAEAVALRAVALAEQGPDAHYESSVESLTRLHSPTALATACLDLYS